MTSLGTPLRRRPPTMVGCRLHAVGRTLHAVGRTLHAVGRTLRAIGVALVSCGLLAGIAAAQPPVAPERIELVGTIVALSPQELVLGDGVGIQRIGLAPVPTLPGRARVEVPGQPIEVQVEMASTAMVLADGQWIRFRARCRPDRMTPLEVVRDLELGTDADGWEQGLFEPADEPGGREEPLALSDERIESGEPIEVVAVGRVSGIERKHVVVDVDRRRLRVPYDETSAFYWRSNDPRNLFVGDAARVTARVLAPAIGGQPAPMQAVRIQSRHVEPRLASVRNDVFTEPPGAVGGPGGAAPVAGAPVVGAPVVGAPVPPGMPIPALDPRSMPAPGEPERDGPVDLTRAGLGGGPLPALDGGLTDREEATPRVVPPGAKVFGRKVRIN